MLNIEQALSQDRLLRALTGMNRRAFESLLSTFIKVYEQSIQKQPRTRARIQRPKDREKQKLNYSGKKKHHSRKHIAAVDKNKRVLVLSQAREGKVHDKRAHDEDDIAGAIPEEIPIEVDSGFLGLQKQYDNIHLPHRKPKGGELSETQQEENRLLSSSRVLCENAFDSCKRKAVQ